jgi:hypothetical protein
MEKRKRALTKDDATTTTLELSIFLEGSKEKDTLHLHHAIQMKSKLMLLSRLLDAGINYIFSNGQHFSATLPLLASNPQIYLENFSRSCLGLLKEIPFSSGPVLCSTRGTVES